MAKNPVDHTRSKHIDIQHHFVREKMACGELRLEYVPTEEMVADVMTKALSAPKFSKCIEKMHLWK